MSKHNRILVWFSCGVTSTVAAKMALDRHKNTTPVEIVCIDTGSEHDDNWRFMDDVSKWLDHEIKRIKSPKYENTHDVYKRDKYLVGVGGARCSLVLKKKVRESYQDLQGDLQVFGYDASEKARAERFQENHPLVNMWCPLIDHQLTKDNCHQILMRRGVKRPITYDMGFKNANCLKTGCVKGQMGYWLHYKKHFPNEFREMAKIERELDVAICKRYVNGERVRVFLDELQEGDGNYNSEASFQCGLFCQLPPPTQEANR